MCHFTLPPLQEYDSIKESLSLPQPEWVEGPKGTSCRRSSQWHGSSWLYKCFPVMRWQCEMASAMCPGLGRHLVTLLMTSPSNYYVSVSVWERGVGGGGVPVKEEVIWVLFSSLLQQCGHRTRLFQQWDFCVNQHDGCKPVWVSLYEYVLLE